MKKSGNLAEAEKHLLFQHDPTTTEGWITLAKKDPATKRFRQYHYQPAELAECLAEWTGEDIYYSQNTFFKPQRRIDNIRQLRSLFVDLDVYTMNLTPEWVLGKLELEYFRQEIPEPNMVIYSGRGIVLVWNIEPIPYMAMPLWRAVENHFVSKLRDLGADTKATDPARIFRLSGSVNSKSGTTVRAEYRHTYRYDIHDLQHDYLPELTPAPKTKKKAPAQGKVINLFNLYSLHMTRARDIAKLVELRQGDVNNHRELICFLYRYFTCCCSNDPHRALADTLDLNSEFIEPLKEKEVRAATRSAEKAWRAKTDAEANEAAKLAGFPGAGYNLKNTKIIEWLAITPEEQREMQVIINQQEKNRRRREAYQKQPGKKSMDEYNQQRKQTSAEKEQTLRQLTAQNPDWTNAQLAQEMDTTVRTIQRIKARIAKAEHSSFNVKTKW